MAMIAPQDYSGNLGRLVVETFEGPPAEGGSAYLGKGAGLFQTIAPITAEKASRAPHPGTPTIAAHCVHVAYYVEALHGFLVGCEPALDWPGSWKVQVVDDAEWDAVRTNLRVQYRQLCQTIQTRTSWDDDPIGDTLAILVHTAYHLGAIRQIVRAVTR